MIKKIYLSALLLGMISLGCSKNDDDTTDNAQQFDCSNPNLITQDYLDSVNAFFNNPSENTCNALKEEAIEFLEAIDQCNIQVEADIEALIEEYENLDCSDFAG